MIDDLRSVRAEQKRARDRAYYLANRDALMAAMRARYAADPESYATAGKAYYEANTERINARNKAWRDANIERERAAARARHAANPESSNARAKAWREANPERDRANGLAWRAANPERFRMAARRQGLDRRSRLRDAFVESIDHDAVFIRDGGVCQICDAFIGDAKWEIDHVIPISRGGPHSYVNVQLAHRICNRSKHNKVPA